MRCEWMLTFFGATMAKSGSAVLLVAGTINPTRVLMLT
jgi:hypothetical protein